MSIEQATAALAQLRDSLGAGLATTENPYQAALMEFGPVLQGPPTMVDVKGGRDYRVSHTGKIMYANGVIYDPEQGVLAPPGKAVPGSREWLLKIQDEWNDKEADKWRKKLWDLGYVGGETGLQAETGGMAHDLLSALSVFHTNRYANGGRVQRLAPTESVATRESIRESIDFKTLKNDVKAWGQVPFGEDLADEEADWLADQMVRKMVQLAKKHPTWTGEQLQAGAQTRVQERFTEQPQVAALIQEQEDQEVSYKIRDSIVGLDQLLGA